jgi:hypothetical protein
MNSLTKTAQMSALLGSIFGAPGNLKASTDWIEELLNPEALTKNAVFFAALFQNFKTRYNPTAFYHVLEMDQSRGYDAVDPYTGTTLIDPMTGEPMKDRSGKDYVFQASQGHLEKFDYDKFQNEINAIPAQKGGVTTEHQFSELKPKNDMPMFVKKNITINEDSPEYKQMFKDLYPGVRQPPKAHHNKPFVKVAQNQPLSKQESPQKIKQLLPKWDMNTLIADLDNIAQVGESQQLTPEQISLQVQNKLKQYKDAIKPLHDYLEKNGFGQKTK